MTTITQMTTITTTKRPRLRLALLLWSLGLAGAFSLLQMSIRLPEGIEAPFSATTLRWLGVLQSGVLVSLAVLIGLFTAPNVGLAAPVAEAVVAGRPWWLLLRRQLWPAFLGALLGAFVLGIYGLLQPWLMPALVAAAQATPMPLLVRVLYGGITEELLLRWGGMSLLVWLLWRFGQRGQGQPQPGVVWIGNLLAALGFGLGHLPIVATLGVAYTLPLVVAIVLGNAMVSLVYGWLYWKKGLEAAMLAHAGTHLLTVLLIAPLLNG